MKSAFLFARSGIVAAFILMLAACSVGSPTGEVMQKEAEAFYKARQDQNVDLALGYYSSNRTAEEWRTHFEHVISSLGQVESYKKIGLEVNTVLSGRYYIFDYTVNYSLGTEARETLTFFDSVKEDDKFGIVSHVISADGYRQLF